ncbi:MAG: hypothetical protein Q4C30_02180 [Bacteroidia bacterium]|nr:hypothetical protein [Bacteroidia bacterium]
MKNFLLLVFSAFLLTSCLKDDEEKFEILTGSNYILQETTGGDNFRYSPYIYTYSSSMSFKLTDVTVSNSEKSIPTKKLTDYAWVTTGSFSSLDDIKGTYKLIAVNDKDDTIEETLDLSKLTDKDIIGDIDLVKFEYVKDSVIAVVHVPENAVALGFTFNFASAESKIDQVYDNFLYKEYEYTTSYKDPKTGKDVTVTKTLLDQADKDGNIRLKYYFDTDSENHMLGYNIVQVGVFASSRYGVHRVGAKKFLSKNAQGF